MTTNGSRPRHHHAGRRLAIAACVIGLAVVSAFEAFGRVPGPRGVAVGGQLSVHPEKSAPSLQNEVPDGPLPPDGPQPLTLSVPAGPHLTVPILYYHYIRVIVPTPQNVVDMMLKLAKIKPGDVIYDLGSGDGRGVNTRIAGADRVKAGGRLV